MATKKKTPEIPEKTAYEKYQELEKKEYELNGVRYKFKKPTLKMRKEAEALQIKLIKEAQTNFDTNLDSLQQGFNLYNTLAVKMTLTDENIIKELLSLCLIDGEKINIDELSLWELDNTVMQIYNDFFFILNTAEKEQTNIF